VFGANELRKRFGRARRGLGQQRRQTRLHIGRVEGIDESLVQPGAALSNRRHIGHGGATLGRRHRERLQQAGRGDGA
jgi:hypothetical protein